MGGLQCGAQLCCADWNDNIIPRPLAFGKRASRLPWERRYPHHQYHLVMGHWFDLNPLFVIDWNQSYGISIWITSGGSDTKVRKIRIKIGVVKYDDITLIIVLDGRGLFFLGFLQNLSTDNYKERDLVFLKICLHSDLPVTKAFDIPTLFHSSP